MTLKEPGDHMPHTSSYGPGRWSVWTGSELGSVSQQKRLRLLNLVKHVLPLTHRYFMSPRTCVQLLGSAGTSCTGQAALKGETIQEGPRPPGGPASPTLSHLVFGSGPFTACPWLNQQSPCPRGGPPADRDCSVGRGDTCLPGSAESPQSGGGR